MYQAFFPPYAIQRIRDGRLIAGYINSGFLNTSRMPRRSGMESGAISDEQVRASLALHGTHQGRLNFKHFEKRTRWILSTRLCKREGGVGCNLRIGCLELISFFFFSAAAFLYVFFFLSSSNEHFMYRSFFQHLT